MYYINVAETNFFFSHQPHQFFQLVHTLPVELIAAPRQITSV